MTPTARSSSIDWPRGLDRTPTDERESTRRFSASKHQTGKELADEMRRIGAADWEVSTASGGSYTKQNGVPKRDANPDDPGVVIRWSANGSDHAVAADGYASLKANFREAYLYIREQRMSGERKVSTPQSNFAAAELPPGDEDGAVAPDAAPSMGVEEAADVLGVATGASERLVKTAYQEVVQDAHPDKGGSREAFRRARIARDVLLDDD